MEYLGHLGIVREMPTSPDRMRGHLDGLLLAVLLHGPRHGYAVIAALREQSGGELDLPEGTVYPALHRLERAGLLASNWEPGVTRRRRVYALTSLGHRALRAQRHEWSRFAAAVQNVLQPGGAA